MRDPGSVDRERAVPGRRDRRRAGARAGRVRAPHARHDHRRPPRRRLAAEEPRPRLGRLRRDARARRRADHARALLLCLRPPAGRADRDGALRRALAARGRQVGDLPAPPRARRRRLGPHGRGNRDGDGRGRGRHVRRLRGRAGGQRRRRQPLARHAHRLVRARVALDR